MSELDGVTTFVWVAAAAAAATCRVVGKRWLRWRLHQIRSDQIGSVVAALVAAEVAAGDGELAVAEVATG